MFQVSFTPVTDFYQECWKLKNAKYSKVETACMLHVTDVCLPRCGYSWKIEGNSL